MKIMCCSLNVSSLNVRLILLNLVCFFYEIIVCNRHFKQIRLLLAQLVSKPRYIAGFIIVL